MNILYISAKKDWGGVISMKVRTAQELSRRGHQLWILSSRKSVLTRKSPSDIHLIPKKFGMDYNPFLITYLLFFIKKHKVDLIVTNIKKEVIAGGIAAKVCGIPCIRIIGNERDFRKIKWLQMNFIDKNIFPCKYTKEITLRSYPWLPEKSCHVIYIGRDVNHFSEEEIVTQREQWGLKPDDLIIGMTSRLTRSKGVDFLITGFSKILKNIPGLYLVITGRGKQKGDFEALAKDLGLGKNIIFSGFTSNPGLAAAAYDIGILPSDYEAFPYALVEYMSVGTPVVSTRVGGTEELIRDRKNGFLIESRDEEQLVDRCSVLIRDETLRHRFSKAAIETIDHHFSEKIMMDRFEAFYKESVQD